MGELRFDGRCAVVTGAGRGLGRAYALLLAARGASVVVSDAGCGPDGRGGTESVAEAVVEEIRRAGGRAWASADTVATEEGAAAIVEVAHAQIGRVDILVHNAGIVSRASPSEVSAEMVNAVLGVHLHGAFWLVRAAWEHQVRQRYGRIVLTGSAAGLYGMPRNPVYVAAKAALVGYMKTLALDGREHGINANVISPIAYTRLAAETMRGPLAEWMERECLPSKVAPVVAWLCHESCQASGETIVAGGGRVARVLTAETVGIHYAQPTVEAVSDDFDSILSEAGAGFVDSVLGSTRLAGAPIGLDSVGYTAAALRSGSTADA